eukprot:m.204792 g.204792  ORF g.204792 m.204792 type:complete len:170 (+) comp16886_c8_seq1:436-945(+)
MSDAINKDDLQVKIKSSDDREFTIPMKVARMSVTIKNMLQDLGWDESEEAFPIPGVEASILEKVITYCTHHADEVQDKEDATKKDEPSGFDAEFLRDMDQNTLFKIILASNFLDIKSLLDLTCKHIAKMIHDCPNPDAIRKLFNIKNDFTPAEEEQVRRENEWIEDKLA